MGLHFNTSGTAKNNTRTIVITGILVIILQLIAHFTVWAQGITNRINESSDLIRTELSKQLNDAHLLHQLNFPNSVKRFYAQPVFEPNWLRSEENIAPTVSAMLLLDCVKQFGLQHASYHPNILTYERMYAILAKKNGVPAAKKVEFELMLTDAMISMINHLHFGAYNPSLSPSEIDNGIPGRLKAEEFLRTATASRNVMDTILTVQPKIEQYRELQGYMKLIAGQYLCDSYETPALELKKIAMNMERLRWISLDQDTYLHVNIPSFQLFYQRGNTMLQYKVVVGSAVTPTPTLQSAVYLIETGPDWKVPEKIFINELLPKAIKDNAFFENNHMVVYDTKANPVSINKTTLNTIKENPKKYFLRQSAGCDNALGKVVFRFANSYAIYLHDTPDQLYFKKAKRALSHGCIRVENAGKLGALLLQQDHQEKMIEPLTSAIETYTKATFQLNHPVPIIITYLTYTVQDKLLIKHNDVYHLDLALEQLMYGKVEQLNKNKPL